MLLLTNLKDTRDGKTSQLPNNATMNVKKIGSIPLSISLSTHSKKINVFDGLHIASLISLVQLCDNDCIAILDKNDINILKNKKLILKVHINKKDGLWYIPVSRLLTYCAHEIIAKDNTKTELISYLHGWCFSPIPKTFLKEIKNGSLLTYTSLNNQHLLKHLPSIIATALVHMYQERKNLQSTKQVNQSCKFNKTEKFTHKRNNEDTWVVRNNHPIKHEKKGLQRSNWSLPIQVKQRKFLCHWRVWLWY